MKMLAFAYRNTKEILRDPLTLGFGLIFPVLLLVLLNMIQRNIPVSLFELQELTPGIAVFGLSFFSLFAAQLLAKDRASAFLARLLTTPMHAPDFILGYMLPLLPMAMMQCAVLCITAILLGMPFTGGAVLLCLVILLPAAFFIGLGVLLGSVLTDKQVGGICGALLTNLTAWLSGVWFDLSLMGAGFCKIAQALPFVRAVQLGRAVLKLQAVETGDLLVVLAYAVITVTAAIVIFSRRMKNI